MLKRRCVILGLVVLSFLCAMYNAPGQDSAGEEAYLRNIEARVVKTNADRIAVEFSNRNGNLLAGVQPYWSKTFWLVVPSHGSQNISLGSFEGEVFKGSEKISLYTDRDTSPVFTLPELPRIVNYKDEGQFRSVLIAGVKFSPCQLLSAPPNEKTQLVFRRLTVEIAFSGVPPAPKQPAVRSDEIVSPLSRSILKPLVLDYDALGQYALPRPDAETTFEKNIRWTTLVNSRISSGPVAKAIVYEPGVYVIRYEDLNDAGIPADNLVPERLRLLHEGRDVPILVDAKKRNTFSLGDAIYFCAPPFDQTKEPYNAYWLFAEPDVTKYPPRRIPVNRLAPTVDKGFVPITVGKSVVKKYRKLEYNSSLPLPSPSGRWYWDKIVRGQYRNYPFELDPLSGGSKTTQLSLVLTTQEKVKSNHCEVYINRHRIGEVSWTGYGCRRNELSVPTALLRQGTNEISLYIPPVAEEPSADDLYFIGFEIAYDRSLENNPQSARFSLVNAPQSAGKIYIQFGRALSPDLEAVHVFNVTNPESPVALPIQFVQGPAVSCAVDSASPRSEYVAATPLTARVPASIVSVKPFPLAEMSHPTSYVIISHPRFIPHLRPFVEARERDGLKVSVINVEDTYDIFNYGEKTCAAIRDFLNYLYLAQPKEMLDYVLLVGESSDYVGNPNELTSQIQEDLLPVWGYGSPGGGAHGDNQYTLICGTDDIPDLAIGRFSVNSVEDVDAYIQKAIAYSTQSMRGDWTARHLFVTDDDSEFPILANYIIERHFPDWMDIVRLFESRFPYEDFYRITNRKRSVEATDALIDAINGGALTTNYFGHGGPNIWSSERLFHLNDVNLLHNSEHLTFVTCSTCDTAWLDYPTTPVRYALGEMLTKAPNGGAIGVFAPTAGASPTDHRYLMDYLFAGLFDHHLRRTGDASLYAKILFIMERQTNYVNDQFVLLGDPFISLHEAKEPSMALSVSPSVASASTTQTLRIEGKLEQPTWGWAKVFFKDPKGENQLLDQFVRVFNGRFVLEYPLQKNLEVGRHLFTAYVSDKARNTEAWGVAQLTVEKPRLELAVNYQKPAGRDYLVAGDQAVVTIEVKNLTDIYHPVALLRVYQEQESEPIITRHIEIQPKRTVMQTFQSNTVAGVHYFNITVAPDPKSEKSDEFSKDLLMVVESGLDHPLLQANPEEIRTTPPQLFQNDKPTFDVTVHNLGNAPQRDVHCVLGIEGRDVIGEETIPTIPARGDVTLKFSSNDPLPAGTYPVRLLLRTSETTGSAPRYQFSSRRALKVNEIADLIIVPGSIEFSSAHFLNGETVFIKALIRNIGGLAANDFRVEAFTEQPWVRENVIENAFKTPNIEMGSLAPGEERQVTIRWDRVGPPRGFNVFVVANSDKKVREANYENNVASKEIQFLRHGNLAAPPEAATVSRKTLRHGDRVNITFDISNTGSSMMPGVPIECFEYAEGAEPVRYGEDMGSHPLSPGEKETFSLRWKPTGYVNTFKVVANPYKEIQENNYDDDTVVLPFDYVLSIPDLKRSADGYYRLDDLLLLGSTQFSAIDPAGVISCTQFKDAPRKLIDISPEFLTEPLPEGKAEADYDIDNRWRLRRQWLEASPKEDPEPIQFEFPMDAGDNTSVYDVYIDVQTMRRFRGFPATKVRLKCEGEKDFKTYDFSANPGAFTGQHYLIGRYDIADGFFDVTIDDVPDNYWTIVNGFEFAPVKAAYISTPIGTGKSLFSGKEVQFKMKSSTPAGTRVVASVRFGEEEGSKGIDWQPWQPISFSQEGVSPSYSVDKKLFQWQVELFPSVTSNPEVEDFGFRIQ